MKNNQAETLLKQLMEIKSISGQEEKILLFLTSLLEKENFEIQSIPVSQKTYCLLATIGNPKIILQAHLDTVQPYIPFSEDQNFIYGRGSCDTKASVATMIISAIQAKNKGLNNFGLLFTVEEETSFKGAIAAATFFGKQKPFFVVGEPSSLQPITSHYGIEVFIITALGKTSHTSVPENGVNAIDLLFSAYKKLNSLTLGLGTLAATTQISGGIAPNIIPDQAKLVFSMRIAPDDCSDYFSVIGKLISPLNVERSETIKPVQGNLPKSLKFLGKSLTVRYCTELAFFQNGFILGPGDIFFAHAQNERIPKSELVKAVVIYQKIIEAF